MSFGEDLKAYLDGELEPLRAAEIEAALERDSTLRLQLKELQAIAAAVRECSAAIEPVGLDRTIQALEGRRRARSLQGRWLWGSGIAVAATVVGLLWLPKLERLAASENDASATESQVVAMKDRRQARTMIQSESSPVAATEKTAQQSAKQKDVPPVFMTYRGTANNGHAPHLPESKTMTAPLQSRSTRKNSPSVSSGTVAADSVNAPKPAGVVNFFSPGKPVAVERPAPLNLRLVLPKEAAVQGALGVSPSIVRIVVASRESGLKQVEALVKKYAPGQTEAKMANIVDDAGATSLTVEVPESVADGLIADLKQIPTDPLATVPTVSAMSARSQGQAFAGGGVGGGRFGGGNQTSNGQVNATSVVGAQSAARISGGGGFGGGIGGVAQRRGSPRTATNKTGRLTKNSPQSHRRHDTTINNNAVIANNLSQSLQNANRTVEQAQLPATKLQGGAPGTPASPVISRRETSKALITGGAVGAKSTGAASTAASKFPSGKLAAPRTRRIIIVIVEKPKPQP